MRILVAPNPALREKSMPVTLEEIETLKPIAGQLAELMYESQGCGLAAPQVGINKRLIVVDVTPLDEDGNTVEKNPVFYFNPVVKRLWGDRELTDEGCLSIPGIQIPIERYNNIEVEARDLDGELFTVEAEGFHARALQHELDHLEGKTMFEHLDPLERIEMLKKYEEALQAGAKPGDTTLEEVKGSGGKDGAGGRSGKDDAGGRSGKDGAGGRSGKDDAGGSSGKDGNGGRSGKHNS